MSLLLLLLGWGAGRPAGLGRRSPVAQRISLWLDSLDNFPGIEGDSSFFPRIESDSRLFCRLPSRRLLICFAPAAGDLILNYFMISYIAKVKVKVEVKVVCCCISHPANWPIGQPANRPTHPPTCLSHTPACPPHLLGQGFGPQPRSAFFVDQLTEFALKWAHMVQYEFISNKTEAYSSGSFPFPF